MLWTRKQWFSSLSQHRSHLNGKALALRLNEVRRTHLIVSASQKIRGNLRCSSFARSGARVDEGPRSYSGVRCQVLGPKVPRGQQKRLIHMPWHFVGCEAFRLFTEFSCECRSDCEGRGLDFREWASLAHGQSGVNPRGWLAQYLAQRRLSMGTCCHGLAHFQWPSGASATPAAHSAVCMPQACSAQGQGH